MKRVLETEGCGRSQVVPLSSSVDTVTEPRFPCRENEGNKWALGIIAKIKSD